MLLIALLCLNGTATAALPASALPSLAPMLKQAMPAVVNISAVSYRDRSLRPTPGNNSQPAAGQGSGVVVDAARGYILTSHHVIAEAAEIRVTLSDNRRFTARVLGSDPATDVAVIRIDASGLRALDFADSEALQVGDFVVAIGNPFGLSQTATLGIVSGLGRAGLAGGIENYIQTDAQINPGNSGGALVNQRGELVGMNTLIFAKGGVNIGIGFAVPANLSRRVMNELLGHGAVRRGDLGVLSRDLDPALARSYGLGDASGAVITRITPNSPAAGASMRVGDAVLAVNGRRIESAAALRNAVGLQTLGDWLSLEVFRDGARRQIMVRLGDGSSLQLAGAGLHPSLTGAELADQGQGGVLVLAIARDSAAWQAGLRVGDVLLEANRQSVNDLTELRRALRYVTADLLLLVQRNQRAYYVTIR